MAKENVSYCQEHTIHRSNRRHKTRKDPSKDESDYLQRAIFTGASPDIVAADMLNFCVRDENRCVHIAIATRSL